MANILFLEFEFYWQHRIIIYEMHLYSPHISMSSNDTEKNPLNIFVKRYLNRTRNINRLYVSEFFIYLALSFL